LKFGLKISEPVLDGEPASVNQPIGWHTISEIERWLAFGGGNPDHGGAKIAPRAEPRPQARSADRVPGKP
jgi:hypothetical protein